jgi:predicted DNA-binding antitoxin AbrB/MazE fold protein
MTIAPGDVEQLLQNARVGKMVFDSTIGKWVKVRSQSETGGLLNGKVVEEEQQNLNTLGQFGSEEEESSEEDDIFKDIESLNSKRGSDSSGSRLMGGGIHDDTQTSVALGLSNDQDYAENEQNVALKNNVEADPGVPRNSMNNKKKGLAGRSDKFLPKSALKIANECSPNKTNASMISSSTDDSNAVTGVLKPSRSVSFQDGRKNGKIIGLTEGNDDQEEGSDERTFKNDHPRPRRESAKEEPLRRSKKVVQGEEKENKQNHVGSSDSENEDDNTSLHQTSKILMNSIKKRVRRKSSSTSNTTASQSNSSAMATPQARPSRHKSSSNNNLSMTTTTSHSNNLIEEYSFELNYSKLIKIITDFEPFEPFWNSIKVINLAGKSIDSVIRLNEILPALDQIDLWVTSLFFDIP